MSDNQKLIFTSVITSYIIVGDNGDDEASEARVEDIVNLKGE